MKFSKLLVEVKSKKKNRFITIRIFFETLNLVNKLTFNILLTLLKINFGRYG